MKTRVLHLPGTSRRTLRRTALGQELERIGFAKTVAYRDAESFLNDIGGSLQSISLHDAGL
jgi:hypothetical protein